MQHTNISITLKCDDIFTTILIHIKYLKLLYRSLISTYISIENDSVNWERSYTTSKVTIKRKATSVIYKRQMRYPLCILYGTNSCGICLGNSCKEASIRDDSSSIFEKAEFSFFGHYDNIIKSITFKIKGKCLDHRIIRI